jgi:hypothetical protein
MDLVEGSAKEAIMAITSEAELLRSLPGWQRSSNGTEQIESCQATALARQKWPDNCGTYGVA